MEPIRTDLAVERTAAAPSLPGVTQETRGNAFSVTEIRIKNDVCGAPIGKPAGRYVTLEAPAISRSSANYQEMAEELAAELGKFLPQEGCVFLAGLGNRAITPLWGPALLRKCWQRGTSAPPSLRRNSPICRNCGQSVCLPAVCWGRPAWSRQN